MDSSNGDNDSQSRRIDVEPVIYESQDSERLISETMDWTDESAKDNDLVRFERLRRVLDRAMRKPESIPVTSEPKMIGPFQILRTLGSGGGGVVYLGRDPVLGRQVAVKVPHGSTLLHEDSRARFLQEAKLISELRHANIVEIFQVGTDGNCPFLVFEYCAEGSLADWLARQKLPVAERVCAEIILALARAAHHAHVRRILHRDLNPRNVLLVPLADGERITANSLFPYLAKLSDFGLGTWLDERQTAVHTQSGTVMGTLPYMAPEQTAATKEGLQATVDVYALGVILYELLTLRRPFAGATPVETLRLIQNGEPMPVRQIRKSIPRDLETICMKCLERSPFSRYSSAGSLAADLEFFLAGNPIRARRSSVLERVSRWIAKRRTRIGIATLAATVLIAVAIRGSWLLDELRNSRSSEQTVKETLANSTEKLSQTQDSVKQLERDAQQKAARLRHLNYIDQIRTISLQAKTHRLSSILALREWIPKANETDLRGFEWYYLIQACGGDASVLSKFNSRSEHMVHIAPEGQGILASDATSIAEWDLKTGRRREFNCVFPFEIRDFTVSRTRRTLLAAMHGTPVVDYLDFGPGSDGLKFPITEQAPFHSQRLRFLPGEQEFLSICNQSPSISAPSVLLWHDGTGKSDKILDSITWPEGRVFDAVGNPSDNSVIVAVTDSIEVYDSNQGSREKIQELKFAGHGLVLSLAITHDGRQLALSTEDETVFLCRKNAECKWALHETAAATGQLSRLDEIVLQSERKPLEFNAAGTRLFSARKSGLSQFDVSHDHGFMELRHIELGRVIGLDVLPDGESVVWSTGNSLGRWHPIPELPAIQGHSKETWAVAFSPDGKWLATGSDDETIRVWDMEKHVLRAELSGHAATVTHVAFSPDGKWLASSSLDGTIRIWDADSLKLKSRFGNPKGEVRALTWFPDSMSIATSDSIPTQKSHVIHVWDVESSKSIRAFPGLLDRIPEVLVSDDQKHIIGVADCTRIAVWSLEDGHLEWSVMEDAGIHSAILIDQDRVLVTGNNRGFLMLRELQTGTLLGTLQGHSDQILTLALSPDGRVLASGSVDQTICLWDTEFKSLLMTINDLPAQINDLAFSPSGETLAAALHDGTVKTFHAPRRTLPRIEK